MKIDPEGRALNSASVCGVGISSPPTACSKSETVKHRDEVKHNIAREALKTLGIEKAIEVVSIADLPAGTGLGSSSCYTIKIRQKTITFRMKNTKKKLKEIKILIRCTEFCH